MNNQNNQQNETISQIQEEKASYGASESMEIEMRADITQKQEAALHSVPIMKKFCNCKQSRCIKLYCECYSAGIYCRSCNCVDCLNNNTYEDRRKAAIQTTLERNPAAFQPKISGNISIIEPTKVLPEDPNLGRHNKGCACKKSGCMKKYCECYQAKVPCTENCKCSDCHNTGLYGFSNTPGINFKQSPGGKEEGFASQNPFLYKLLLANSEEHLLSILNEKMGGESSLNGEEQIGKKAWNISDEFLEKACQQLVRIIDEKKEDFIKKEDNKKFIAAKKEQMKSKSTKEKTNLTSQTIVKEENKEEKEKKIDSTNNDEELLCDDEIVQDGNRPGRMEEELEENGESKKPKEKEPNHLEKEAESNEKLSFFQCKQDLILKQFIEILKSLEC